jgi:hypothetical protein
MTENQTIRYRFSVSVKAIRAKSNIEAKGTFPTSITFHLQPPGRLGLRCDDVPFDLFGEGLNRAVRLQQSSEPCVVEVGPDWWVQHCKTWEKDIVDLALQRFAFAKIPGGISGGWESK